MHLRSSLKGALPLLAAIYALAFLVRPACAQDRAAIEAALEMPVAEFSVGDRPAREVLESLARSYSIPMVIEDEVQGNVSFRIFGAKVRNVLSAICAPKGWLFEIDDAGYLVVRRFVTRVYSVDYLQLKQQGTSSASVTLNGGATSTGNGQQGMNGGTVASVASSGVGTNGAMGAAANGGSGSSNIALNATNEGDFWTLFEGDVKKFLEEGESVAINRFAGIVQLRASLRTHAQMDVYVKRVMQRVRRSAKITVRQLIIDVTNAKALGVDWNVAQFRIGAEGRNAPQIGGTYTPLSGAAPVSGFGTTNAGITEVGGNTLPGETFRMVVGVGKVGALITALQEQGNVTVEDRSSASALNNQMALIQVSEDRPLFRRTFTSQTQTGASVGSVTQTNTNYDLENVSFGNVLEVTPQIDDNLVTTLALAPSLTDFRGSVTSPDGASTAFNVGVKRYRSTIVLRNGETAVIGGFIQTSEGTQTRGVAGLSNLPVLGGLFKHEAKSSVRREMVLLITVEAEDPTLPQPTKVDQPKPDQVKQQPVQPAKAVSKPGHVELVGDNS